MSNTWYRKVSKVYIYTQTSIVITNKKGLTYTIWKHDVIFYMQENLNILTRFQDSYWLGLLLKFSSRVVEYSNTLVYSIGVKCGYSTTLGKYAWIPHYSWEICRYSSTIKPKFLTAILRLMEQVYFILLPVRTCIRICIPGVKAVIHSIP